MFTKGIPLHCFSKKKAPAAVQAAVAK